MIGPLIEQVKIVEFMEVATPETVPQKRSSLENAI